MHNDMTFKELLKQVTFADIAPFVEQAIRNNENDMRDFDTKFGEVERAFGEMADMKPTFGHITSPIEVKLLDGRLSVSNMHLGSTSDVLSHRMVIAPEVQASVPELVAECVYQLVGYQTSTERYRDGDEFDDLDPLMARIVR